MATTNAQLSFPWVPIDILAGPDLAGGKPGAPGGRPGPSGVFGISERDWLSNYRVLKIGGGVWWETPCW